MITKLWVYRLAHLYDFLVDNEFKEVFLVPVTNDDQYDNPEVFFINWDHILMSSVHAISISDS